MSHRLGKVVPGTRVGRSFKHFRLPSSTERKRAKIFPSEQYIIIKSYKTNNRGERRGKAVIRVAAIETHPAPHLGGP